AEDGIRYFHVTGVQTCALPISTRAGLAGVPRRGHQAVTLEPGEQRVEGAALHRAQAGIGEPLRDGVAVRGPLAEHAEHAQLEHRSEERRVGKGWRSRRAADGST